MADRAPRVSIRSLIGLLLTALACGPADESIPMGALHHEIDSTGAFVRIQNSGTPPEWILEPVLTVGSQATLGEPAPDEFGQITSVTTDRHGNLWVADAMNRSVKVFASGGSLLRTIGREGQGPGEFLAIYSIAWVGDVLLVMDLGNGRVAELSESGEWLGMRPAPGSVSGSPALMRFYAVSDTVVYQWSLRAVGGRAERVWIEHNQQGVTAEWPQLRQEAPQPMTILCDAPDGSIRFMDIPFAGKLIQHPAGNGMTYVTWTRDYRIALVDSNGDTVRVINRDSPRVSIEDSAWESAALEYAEFREKWPGARCEPRDISRPDAKAALRNLLVDTSGRMWIEVFTDSGLAWEVFDRDGVLIAVVPGFQYDERVAPSLRDNLVAWVETDSLGVQRVRMARIHRPTTVDEH